MALPIAIPLMQLDITAQSFSVDTDPGIEKIRTGIGIWNTRSDDLEHTAVDCRQSECL
jgi:hypothetical protein